MAGEGSPYMTKAIKKHLPQVKALKAAFPSAKKAKKKAAATSQLAAVSAGSSSTSSKASNASKWKNGLGTTEFTSADFKKEMAKRKAYGKKHDEILKKLTKTGQISEHLQKSFTWHADKSVTSTQMLAQHP